MEVGTPGEQISKEGDEQLNVVEHQVGHVHVTQRPHEQEQLVLHHSRPEHSTGRSQHGWTQSSVDTSRGLLFAMNLLHQR